LPGKETIIILQHKRRAWDSLKFGNSCSSNSIVIYTYSAYSASRLETLNLYVKPRPEQRAGAGRGALSRGNSFSSHFWG
jgi:hypothetical protein